MYCNKHILFFKVLNFLNIGEDLKILSFIIERCGKNPCLEGTC